MMCWNIKNNYRYIIFYINVNIVNIRVLVIEVLFILLFWEFENIEGLIGLYWVRCNKKLMW